jgi:hypothetical protein
MEITARITGKKREAALAIAEANPLWSRRHVEMCVEFLMPTSNESYYEPGTSQREAAAQHYKQRLHEFLVEMNIIPPEAAYKKPDDWKSPFKEDKPARRVSTPRVPQEGPTSEPRTPRPASASSSEIKEPRPGSAGAAAWAVCDDFYAEHQRCPTASEARAAGEAKGLNPGNVGTEASRWRKFRGYQQ